MTLLKRQKANSEKSDTLLSINSTLHVHDYFQNVGLYTVLENIIIKDFVTTLNATIIVTNQASIYICTTRVDLLSGAHTTVNEVLADMVTCCNLPTHSISEYNVLIYLLYSG